MSNNVPPKSLGRNDHGLLNGEDYIFNEDGTVNWRKMIKPEFLVPNKQYFERVGKPVPKTIEGLEDKELIILLGGIKDLASKRGFTSVCHTVTAPSDNYVVSTCSINWLENYEHNGRAVTFCSIGDASPLNTNGFGRKYLAAIAENRAFVRCVRNFLKVNIVGQEELGGDEKDGENLEASVSILSSVMEQHGVSFAQIKEVLKADKVDGAENFTSLSDIPKFKQFELIERVKKAAANKKKS